MLLLDLFVLLNYKIKVEQRKAFYGFCFHRNRSHYDCIICGIVDLLDFEGETWINKEFKKGN